MVRKTKRTYKFSPLTISLIEQLAAAFPEYAHNKTRVIELLVLEKAKRAGLFKNGNVHELNDTNGDPRKKSKKGKGQC